MTQHPGPQHTALVLTQAAQQHLTGASSPLPPCCLSPGAGVGWGGSVLTIAHALQEVLEGFSQLPRLWEGGTDTGFDWLSKTRGRREASPSPG